ncbi:MAG TPA: chemotaxis protein CheW [Burkholderiaceae bacterium]
MRFTTEQAQDQHDMQAETQDYLSFRLGEEQYGIGIHQVQELRNYTAVTAIANAPAWIKGVMNLRGLIVPILDLRIRLALGHAVYNPFTVVIILSIAGGLTGVVVDSVSDVITLAQSDVAAVPPLGTTIAPHHLLGVGTRDHNMVLLLDIARMLADEGIGVRASAAA